MKQKYFSQKNAFVLLIFSVSFLYSQAQVIDTIESTDVYTLLTSCDYNKTIIDGRDSVMFRTGHLKNAVYIDAFSVDVVPFLQTYLNSDTLLIYCSNQTRSELLIEHLQQLNYKGHIIYMKDGLTGWKKQKFPLEIPKTD